MNKQEIVGWKRILEEKRRDEIAPVWLRDEIQIEPAAEAIDQLQASAARDIAVGRLNSNSRVVKDIDDALGRMDRDEFGVCVDCEEAISAKRLRAVPWAARCVRCQEALDRRPVKAGEPLQPLAA